MTRFTSKHTMDELVNTIKQYYQKAKDECSDDSFWGVFPELVEKDLDIPIGFSEGGSLWDDFNLRYSSYDEEDDLPWQKDINNGPKEYIREFYKLNDCNTPMENLYLEVREGFPIVICSGSEDDEFITYFIMYLDDKNNIRAYVPKKGNTFNPKTNRPYEVDWDTGFNNMHYKLNLEKFLKDIKENIIFKEN